jgi:hypothetical protein
VEYVASESIRFLREWDRDKRGVIHLLYLDSLDYFEHQRAQSEEHHRAEVAAALPALAPCCLILLDDTEPTGEMLAGGIPRLTGKGARAIPYLLAQGFALEWAEGGQALLSRGTRAGFGATRSLPA